MVLLASENIFALFFFCFLGRYVVFINVVAVGVMVMVMVTVAGIAMLYLGNSPDK
jgi:hypothetical protein